MTHLFLGVVHNGYCHIVQICDTHGQQHIRRTHAKFHQFFNYFEIFWTDFHWYLSNVIYMFLGYRLKKEVKLTCMHFYHHHAISGVIWIKDVTNMEMPASKLVLNYLRRTKTKKKKKGCQFHCNFNWNCDGDLSV